MFDSADQLVQVDDQNDPVVESDDASEVISAEPGYTLGRGLDVLQRNRHEFASRIGDKTDNPAVERGYDQSRPRRVGDPFESEACPQADCRNNLTARKYHSL